MSGQKPVADAEEILRHSLRRVMRDENCSAASLISAVREFAGVDFEVAGNPDADGFLFQYGTFSHLPRPGFIIGFTRQFFLPGNDNEDEACVQLSAEYRYALAPELGRRKEWWFKAEGSDAFEAWMAGISGDPVWAALAERRPVDFSVLQEQV